MAKVPNAIEILLKIWTVWVGRTSVTDDRQTEGRQHIVHVRYLISWWVLVLHLLCSTPPAEAFLWDDLRKIFGEYQWVAKVPNAVKISPKISTVWVGRTSVTDRQTHRRQTDRRVQIANVNVTSRSLKTVRPMLSVRCPVCLSVTFVHVWSYDKHLFLGYRGRRGLHLSSQCERDMMWLTPYVHIYMAVGEPGKKMKTLFVDVKIARLSLNKQHVSF